MRIILCCPFFNENLIARIHVQEASQWVDEFHILETNKTFQYQSKPFVFDVQHPKVHYHAIDVTGRFKARRKWFPHLDLKRRYNPKGFYFNAAWYNEQLQRNLACAIAGIKDDDIVILSDIDEIIDSRQADRIISEVKRRDMLTVRLHFTMFYFNLFSTNWSGPRDYSYRVFMLTGKKLRQDWGFDSDRLRKQGEHGELCDRVYCLPDYAGFHYSWLGDADFVSQKLAAYSHVEHAYMNNKEFIERAISSRSSIFPGHELSVNNAIQHLPAVDAMRNEISAYFI